MVDRVDNEVLREAGLALMQENGKPLTKLPSRGRSMLYTMQNGESVRLRTCNDHILIVVADSPERDARLNIEGTDWLLLVMPEIERTAGRIIGYLVPTEVAVEAVRTSHQAWLSNSPNTKGENTTWNIWFDGEGSGGTKKRASHGYSDKWAMYRLEGKGSAAEVSSSRSDQANKAGSIKAEVDAARRRIARVAAVSPEAVKISIEFSA